MKPGQGLKRSRKKQRVLLFFLHPCISLRDFVRPSVRPSTRPSRQNDQKWLVTFQKLLSVLTCFLSVYLLNCSPLFLSLSFVKKQFSVCFFLSSTVTSLFQSVCLFAVWICLFVCRPVSDSQFVFLSLISDLFLLIDLRWRISKHTMTVNQTPRCDFVASYILIDTIKYVFSKQVDIYRLFFSGFFS